ncbi:Gfo/Idh/MocA family protein [Martelella soudanensis]|uniref:Gfo/Idh/MocA family protein n=1 Tax=unclassified Martelella TaxID=2629616 RepID=UPI0015DED2A5|nr:MULTISPECIES: Gfo/Idh/MocA family oxidoreductase [unclassified Martelella]
MSETKKPVRVLLVGTGGMGRTHAEAYADIPGVSVVAGVDPRTDVLAAFCDRHGIEGRYATLAEAIERCDFDAASVVTPDGLHYATTMPLIASGKHVLCEKPLSTDYAFASEMASAAEAAGIVNMINLSYRNVAALQKAADMIAEGAIGAVRHFEASYLQSWLTQAAWGDWRTEPGWLWRLSTAHGSKGALGDVGIHIVDFATFAAGSAPHSVSCRTAVFHKAPDDRIGDYTLDANDSFVMHMDLANGAIGTITASRFASGHHNDLRLRIYGDKGGLQVLFERGVSHLRAAIGPDALLKEEWSDIECPPVASIYQRFIAAIRGEAPADPTFLRGAELQQVLDLAGRSQEMGSRSLTLEAVAGE